MSGQSTRSPHPSGRRGVATVLVLALTLATIVVTMFTTAAGKSAAPASADVPASVLSNSVVASTIPDRTTTTGSSASGVEDSDAPAEDTTEDTTEDTADADDTDTDDVLEIDAVTPWVASDGDFQVRFAPTTRLPPGAQLTFTVHQPLSSSRSSTLRDEIDRVIGGGSAGKILQAPVTTDFAGLGDPAGGAVLTIPIRAVSNGSERVLLPNAGIHPVELVVTSEGGPELWSQVVFLNRLPAGASETASDAATDPGADLTSPVSVFDDPHKVRVSLLLPIESGAAIAPDGSATFSEQAETALTRTAALLSDVPTAPLSLVIRPNTLDGLQRSTEPWASNLLDALGATELGSVALRTTYVDVDSGALVASDAAEELVRQLDIGNIFTTSVTGREPLADTWALDDTVSAAALSTLRAHGVSGALVATSQLDLADAAAAQDAVMQPFRVEASDGTRGLAYDSTLSVRLMDRNNDPAVRAHQVVSELMATWFTAEEDSERPAQPASAIVVPPDVDPAVIAALEPSLSGNGPLVADPTRSPIPPPVADSSEPVVALKSRPPSDLAPIVETTRSLRTQLDSYRSMSGDGDPSLELWARLDDQLLSTSLDSVGRGELEAAIRTGLANNLDQIELPPARSVVVTSRESSIPLRFRNGLPFDMTVVIDASSPRLEVLGDERPTVVLHPGENRIDLPVAVRAPGQTLLRVQIESPDGAIVIPGPAVPVRSTAISGAGAALSAISIALLIGWWVLTHRRRRRAERQQEHPSAASDDPGETDETSGHGHTDGADTPPPARAGPPDSVSPGG